MAQTSWLLDAEARLKTSPGSGHGDQADTGTRRGGGATQRPTSAPLAFTRLMAILGMTAMIGVVLVTSDASWWSPILLVAVPAVGAWMVRRISLLATLYLTQMTIYFGLTWLLLRQNRSPLLVAAVVLWALGMTVGALASRASTVAPARRTWDPPGWPHFVLTAGLLASQANLIISGQVGVRAQLTLGISTPTGILGILTTAAPVITLMLLVTALGSQRRVAGAALLATVQAGVLALTGFRGSSVMFLIAILAAAAMTLPKASLWRRSGRLTILVVVMMAAAVAGFMTGANVKSQVATELGASSLGNQLFGLDQALPIIAGRIDLGRPLGRAIELRNDPFVKDAVSWPSQLQAVVPRALWPDKPIIDYGQRVALSVYGLQGGLSSSTVTTIGDTLVNFGIPGVLVASVLLGLVLGRAERQIRKGTRLPSLVLSAAVSLVIIGQEAPLPIAGAGLIRNLLVASLLWLGCNALYRRTGSQADPAERTGSTPATRVPGLPLPFK